jgi:hypothetical protein
VYLDDQYYRDGFFYRETYRHTADDILSAEQQTKPPFRQGSVLLSPALNKIDNVCINVTLKRFRVTTVAVEKQ